MLWGHANNRLLCSDGDGGVSARFVPCDWFITQAGIRPLVPLFVAWFFYMIRFYLMPWLLGYSVMGMLSFPLESEFARAIADLIGKLVN